MLKYLNLHIIQSSYGIRFDQSEHIHDIILDPWLTEPSKHVKGLHTLWPTNQKAEQELAEAMLADTQELKALEHEFGDSHVAINGKYMHIMVWSCLE